MKPRERGKTARAVTEYSAGTLELGISVAIGIGIGYALDRYFGTAPWLTLAWLLCGVVAGFRSLFRVAKRLERQDEEDHDVDNS
jgi:ATP synthase protein I